MSNKIFPTDTVVKATLVAGDQFLIADSAATNKVKDITGTILNTFVRGVGGNVTVLTSEWVGLGAAKGRIAFTDAAVDLASVLDSAVLVGSGTPDQAQVAGDAYVTGKFEVDGIVYADGGMIISESIDWADGNVTYVPIGGDIETYVAAATSGDTLVLASGTYTITDDIDVGVGVNIVGQGFGKTTIACATASKNVFDIGTSNVRIADLSIMNTGGSGFGINTTTPYNYTGWVFENLEVNISGSGENRGINIHSTDAEIKNVNVTVSSSDSRAYGIRTYISEAGASGNKEVNVYNSYASADGTGGDSTAFAVYCADSSKSMTMNLYNCTGIALAGDTSDTGFEVAGAGQHNAIGNVYGGTFSGADYDVIQTFTNTLTLYGSTCLVNGTTRGDITYGGTVVDGGHLTQGDSSVVNSNASSTIYNDTYDNSTTTPSRVLFRKSLSDTVGTKTETTDGTYLMQILAQGVDTGSNFDGGVNIVAIQDGSAGTKVPAQLRLETYSATALNANQLVLQPDGNIAGANYSVAKQHEEIGILLDILTEPVCIVGFTGTGASGAKENGYENGAGREWTYSGGLTTDKIFQGGTYVYSFDGVDSYLSTPDTADMSFGDGSSDSAFSIGGWIEIVDDGGTQTIFSKYDLTTGSEALEYRIHLLVDETLLFALYDDSASASATRTTTSALSVGWHHIVMTYDGTGGATCLDGTAYVCYVDGVPVSLDSASYSGTYTAMENLGADVWIGALKGTSGTPLNRFAGKMGRLFVTAEELSASTVWKLYSSTRSFYNK